MTGGAEEGVSMPAPHIYVERTLAIIKPDAIHKSEEIEDIILRSGFAILQVRDLFFFSSVITIVMLIILSHLESEARNNAEFTIDLNLLAFDTKVWMVLATMIS